MYIKKYFDIDLTGELGEVQGEYVSDAYYNVERLEMIKDGLTFTEDMKTQRKKIVYVKPIADDISMKLEAWLDNDVITDCFLDFTAYNRRGKVNGLHILRLRYDYLMRQRYFGFNARYLFRRGTSLDYDILNELSQNNPELLTDLLYGKYTPELVDKVINKFVEITNYNVEKMNNHKGMSTKKFIPYENKHTLASLVEFPTKVVEALKQVKDDISDPYVKENVESFLEAYENKDVKKRTLER